MSDAATHQMQVTSQVTTGAAAARPEQPADGGKEPAWRRVVAYLLNHPNRSKIAMTTVAAVVLVVGFVVQYATVNRSVPAKAGARGRAAEFADEDFADEGFDNFVKLAIPSDLDHSGGLQLPPEHLLKEKKNTDVVTSSRAETTAESKPRPRAPRPRLAASAQVPTMPEWLQPITRSSVIPEHLSLRHESAVDPDALANLK
jgi:hypothetical protein